MGNYQEILKAWKARVFSENPGPSDSDLLQAGIKREIFEAWRHTKRLGVSPDLEALPTESNDRAVFDRLLGVTKKDWALMKDSYHSVGELLEAIGGILYFVDDETTIFNYLGDEALLQELKEFNFKFGYRLSPEFVGVFPANMAQQSKKLSIMIGEEHPVSFLSRFCSIALITGQNVIAPFRSIRTELLGNDYACVIILPIEKYDETNLKICEVILSKLISMCSMPASMTVYADMFTLAEEASQTPVIFISPDNTILYVNKLFEAEFGIPFEKCVGNDIRDAVPELDFLRDILKKQKKMKFTKMDLVVGGVKHTYYFQTHFLRKDSQVYAMKVTISTQGNIDYYVKNLNISGNSARFTFDSLIGDSRSFTKVKEIAKLAARGDSNVLIEGESGTGKELVSQAIHNESNRRNRPFVAINCGSIPKELIGSELFGYEQGAFTGARKEGQIGKFELANGGTILLDEIAEMPLDMQSYLLRVLEERKVTRLGGTKPQNIDVRVIAATNRDIWAYVNEGKFRLDLYFRLNVIKIKVPPLRERRDDIESLTKFFIRELSGEFEKPISGIDPEAMELLSKYNWPGNVRELRNALEYSVNVMQGDTIRIDDLSYEIRAKITGDAVPQLRQHVPDDKEPGSRPRQQYAPDYREYEKLMIQQLMLEHRGNKSRVARELGISRNTLNSRLQSMYPQKPEDEDS